MKYIRKTWQIVLAFPSKVGGKVRRPRRTTMIRAPSAMATSRPMQRAVSQTGRTFSPATAGTVRTTKAVVRSSLSPIGSSHCPRADLRWRRRAVKPSRASVAPAARKMMKAGSGRPWIIMRMKTGVSRILASESRLGRSRISARRVRRGGAAAISAGTFISSMPPPSLGQPLDDVEDADGLLPGDGALGPERSVGGDGHDLVGEGLGDRRIEDVVRG